MAMKPATPIAANASAWGNSRAGRDEAYEDQNGRDEITRIMKRISGERVARGRARGIGQRAPAHDVDDDREQDRADGERADVDLSVAATDTLEGLIATPIESAAKRPVSAKAATASILAWPNG